MWEENQTDPTAVFGFNDVMFFCHIYLSKLIVFIPF